MRPARDDLDDTAGACVSLNARVAQLRLGSVRVELRADRHGNAEYVVRRGGLTEFRSASPVAVGAHLEVMGAIARFARPPEYRRREGSQG